MIAHFKSATIWNQILNERNIAPKVYFLLHTKATFFVRFRVSSLLNERKHYLLFVRIIIMMAANER